MGYDAIIIRGELRFCRCLAVKVLMGRQHCFSVNKIDHRENKSTDVDIMFPAKPPTWLSELSNEVGFPVTNMSFDALLESLLSTTKPISQSAGYRILAS
ncbi:hypothetical protein Tco_0625132 [Tanacetum coccineum]|uniref:Uncharacterized protein n=1 Tax=Tanacetum coccineum TaxID=301880 RepID=A0ABQ4WFZ3_9ASTR